MVLLTCSAGQGRIVDSSAEAAERVGCDDSRARDWCSVDAHAQAGYRDQ